MANTSEKGIDIKALQQSIRNAESLVIEKLEAVKSRSSEKMDVGDLFDIQWTMNKFSQFSEMASAVLAGAHQAISAMTRNIK